LNPRVDFIIIVVNSDEIGISVDEQAKIVYENGFDIFAFAVLGRF
jgi:hypothetical protein